MRFEKEIKAISTILALLLILVAAIVGALIAYMWTMAPFYLEPENTVDLIVTNVNFPVDRANYFDVTIMNPSHSVSDTNITAIYITAEGFNRTDIQSSVPVLPTILDVGTTMTFNCYLPWGELAGNVVTVHAVTSNNTEAARSVTTQSVKLEIDTVFAPSESVQYFNVSVTNENSAINLTINRILLDYNPIENLSITLPRVVPINDSVSFQCFANWEGHVKPIVRAETQEGYIAEKRTEVSSTIILQITQVIFSETDSDEINLTLFNSPDSATSVDIMNLTLTHGNVTETITGDLSNPTLPRTVGKNETHVLTCAWNWTDASYRNIDVTLTAHTKQGFASQSRTVRTPKTVDGRIDAVIFDLDDTGTFTTNLTNIAYSLQTFNVTRIDVDGNVAGINSTLVAPGADSSLTCVYNWSSLIGENATITARIKYDSTETTLLYSLQVPYLKIASASFLEPSPGNLYVSVTIRHSEFSKTNATISSLYARTDNSSLLIAQNIGLTIPKGSDMTLVFPWNWNEFLGQDIKFIVQTTDGYEASATFTIE